ncbi:MAG: hypothetical protein H0U95_04150 [Bacteroidetes bacterium]|nr:hypothetical protein [Bacteroidota bacterium]
MTFVFRLLFVNVGIISSLNSKQNTNLLKSFHSTLKKRRRGADSFNNQIKTEYSAIEICEENQEDEDHISKKNPLVLIRILYSFLANKLASLESNSSFDSVNHKLSSKKYLAISVLRV